LIIDVELNLAGGIQQVGFVSFRQIEIVCARFALLRFLRNPLMFH
jgi:hypothetical protein